MTKTIYLDYNATTPLDPRVLEVMLPYFREHYGNSVSAAHSLGWTAEKAVEKARQQVATLLRCPAQDIFFTAGATESNNWVIRGLVDRLHRETKEQLSSTIKAEFISSPLEHSSVSKALLWAQDQGVKVHFCKVNSKGELDLHHLKSLINQNTKLMSFMWVNNEIGTINPMQELTSIAKQNSIYIHSDATQAIGKMDVNLEQTPIDLLSFSAHKIYGPKGCGVLVKRSKNPQVQIDPLILGGGHEHGQRSGTLNVPAIVGMGEACAILKSELHHDIEKYQGLQKYFYDKLVTIDSKIHLNGPDLGERAPNNLNLSFTDYQIPPSFADIAISRGSACHSGMTSVSPVLKAIGVSERAAEKTLRISLGRWTSTEDIDLAISCLQRLKPI